MGDVGTLVFFQIICSSKVGATFFLSIETIHLSLKSQISGFRVYHDYTYQSPSIPTCEMAIVGLVLINIIEPLSRDYHLLLPRALMFRELHVERPSNLCHEKLRNCFKSIWLITRIMTFKP